MPNTTQGMNWIRKEKRARIHERDKWACVWCGAGLGPDAPQGERTLDHVIARSNGGSNEAHNLITACRFCNTERGDLCAIDYAFGPLFARTGRKPWLVLNDLIECVCRDLPARAPKETKQKDGWLATGLKEAQAIGEARPELVQRVTDNPSGYLSRS